MLRDFYSGKENGVSLAAEACLELEKFRTFRDWFGKEVSRELAKPAEPSQFWSIVAQHGEATSFGPVALKMTSAFLGQGAVESYQKSIGRIRESGSLI